MSEIETNESQADIDANVVEAGVDPESMGAAKDAMSEAIRAMREAGTPVDLAPPDPVGPEPSVEELIERGDLDEAKARIAATQAELDSHPSAQAARETREQREVDAQTGADFREFKAEHEHTQAISAAAQQLVEDLDADAEGELLDWDDEGEVVSVSPELVTRVAGLIEAGIDREGLEALMEGIGEDVMLPVLQGIQAAYQERDVQQQDRAAMEAAIQEQQHNIEGSHEWVRLAQLNPHLDLDRARTYFEGMQFSTPEAGKTAALNSFKLVAAEQEAQEQAARDRKLNIEMFARGDERYYDEVFLPDLARKAFDDPGTYGAQYNALTKPPAVDLDAVFGNPEENWFERMKRDPEGYIERSVALMDERIAANAEKTKSEAEALRAREEHNLKTWGNRAGSHVDSPRR